MNLNRLFLLVSVVLFALMLVAGRAEMRRPWKAYQVDYYRRLEGKVAARAGGLPRARIVQDWIPELDQTERCRTCHIGIDNPEMAPARQPLRAHPGDLLEAHPPDTFGCTVCHEGEGRGTTPAGAHGKLARSATPLLEGAFIQSSCGKCHAEPELEGAPALNRGKDLYRGFDCVFCHRSGEAGGDIGPDLSRVGSKPVFQFDFRNVKGRPTVVNWMMAHFRDPSRVSPGSTMPNYRLRERDIRDLTIYMLSLTGEDLPSRYRVPPPPPEPEAEIVAATPGQALYLESCAVCHGRNGEGRRHFAPALNDQGFLAIASDRLLQISIAKGRPGTAMFTWHEDLGGVFSPQRIQELVQFIRSWQRAPSKELSAGPVSGNRARGRALFARVCANCHGADGKGYFGPALNNAGFLEAAEDAFIREIIASAKQGRPVRSCLQGSERVRSLSGQDVDDLVAFIRGWQGN